MTAIERLRVRVHADSADLGQPTTQADEWLAAVEALYQAATKGRKFLADNGYAETRVYEDLRVAVRDVEAAQ